MADLKKFSVFLALVLRHKPEAAGITLDSHGWADVPKLLKGMQAAGYDIDMAMLEEIVATDNKQRYSFDETHRRIRANQGHSVQVDVELNEQTPPELLWHGTATRFLDSIFEKGLVPGSRLYVHLSRDIQTAYAVGKRHGKAIVLAVRAGDMHRAGHRFWLSENGVWLTEKVPPEYLSVSEAADS